MYHIYSYFPERLLENWSFIKRLIGLSSCPTVKLPYRLWNVLLAASRCFHTRADLQLFAAGGSRLHESHSEIILACFIFGFLFQMHREAWNMSCFLADSNFWNSVSKNTFPWVNNSLKATVRQNKTQGILFSLSAQLSWCTFCVIQIEIKSLIQVFRNNESNEINILQLFLFCQCKVCGFEENCWLEMWFIFSFI